MRTLFGYRLLLLIVSTIAGGGFPVRDGRAASTYSEVLLVAEEGERDGAGRALAARLARIIDYYIGEERAFDVTIIRASDMDRRPEAKNVVVCGVAAPSTSVGRYITELIGTEAVKQVRAERSAVFKRENLPGPDQLTVVVTASSVTDLMSVIGSRGDEIVEIIETSCRERLRRYLVDHKDEPLSRRLHETYGFSVEVPKPYKVLSEDNDPPGVQLLCEGPARLLGVFWLDWSRPPALADSTLLFDARAAYVWKQYDGDAMDSTRVAYGLTRLGSYTAVELAGYWSNSRSIAGGFYRTFFVYEEKEKLLWGVDLLVFAPGLPKHPLFRELHAIAETFRYD
jgi:hypothetical protein